MNEKELFDYCPICGKGWDEHTEIKHIDEETGEESIEQVCNPLTLIMNNKPRFYIQDLENYNEEFLKQIILWQDQYIKYLTKDKEVKP